MKKTLIFLGILSFICLMPLSAQKKKGKADNVNDMNTPLHLLQADYKVPYGMLSIKDIKADMDKVLHFLEEGTPARVINSETGQIITDYETMDANTVLDRGLFRLASYEWGVTYAAMLAAAQSTGDPAYQEYVNNRFVLLAEIAPYFRRLMNDHGVIDPQMRQLLTPHALDDAGAMCAAMVKAQMADKKLELRPLIDNYINYIMYHEYRLGDGTFARNRPQKNTLWLDDMFMSVPAIVQMGRLTGEQKYYNEAVKQIKQFSERMFVPEKGLYRHGWVEGMQDHPSFHWGRANGWAILTLTEVLDALPKSHPEYSKVLEQYRAHIRGITSYQSGDGFWHQLLDRNDSYYETSATAIFVYCIARGINNGWLDPVAYGPVAHLGWHAVSTKINDKGEVEGTCVGTGMGFDPSFYYYRPVNVYAAHGYGPVIWAGSEMINLLKKQFPKMNDSAVQYYIEEQTTSKPIFSVGNDQLPAGSTRKNDNPVVFLIGDSTMKNGRGKGDNGQWGWGSFFEWFFDLDRISIENHALGGRSSRTFYTEGLWNKVLSGIKKGDYLFIQFGHNDGGPLNTGRARASLKGTGEESQMVIMERHGGPEEVYTFGHYLRIYIRQAKAKGANVIVLSHTPGNSWKGDQMLRNNETYGKWSKEVADAEQVLYIDMNDIIARKFEKMGQQAAAAYFIDRVHTSFDGAVMNAKAAIEGVLQVEDCELKNYILPESLDRNYKAADKPLFRDPKFDGAADPVVIWSRKENRWFMFYTNRRANLKETEGVDWVHGTPIGIAESIDGGETWTYKCDANINYGNKDYTYWAPDVIEDKGKYHMFLTVVPGIFSNWQHEREIVHLVSDNLVDWSFQNKCELISDKVIDAAVIKAPNGKWRMYYNNERDNKSIYYSESDDLIKWNNYGKVIKDQRGEGPKVFRWKRKYFMIVDNWNGLGVYVSEDMENWTRQKKNILQGGGTGVDDCTQGQHADVVVNNDRAYIFYFTHPGRIGNNIGKDTYETRRSSLQVAELEYVNGEIICNRDKLVYINLK